MIAFYCFFLHSFSLFPKNRVWESTIKDCFFVYAEIFVKDQNMRFFCGVNIYVQNIISIFLCMAWIIGKQSPQKITFHFSAKVHYNKICFNSLLGSMSYTK